METVVVSDRLIEVLDDEDWVESSGGEIGIGDVFNLYDEHEDLIGTFEALSDAEWDGEEWWVEVEEHEL